MRRQSEVPFRVFLMHQLALPGVEDEEAGPVDKAVRETVPPHAQVGVFLRPREKDAAPFQRSRFHIQNVEFRFGRLLLAIPFPGWSSCPPVAFRPESAARLAVE